jgi:hypothetical protein
VEQAHDGTYLESQSDERENNNEDGDVKEGTMPDPALDRKLIEDEAKGEKDEQGDEEVPGKWGDINAIEVDFLEHGIRLFPAW